MRTFRNPVLVLVLNYVVGFMVAQGLVQPSDQNQVVEILAEIVGYTIILLTSVVSLQKVVKHKHPDEIQETITVEKKNSNAPTESVEVHTIREVTTDAPSTPEVNTNDTSMIFTTPGVPSDLPTTEQNPTPTSSQ